MNRRRLGRAVAVIGALLAFGWAGWAASSSAMPDLRVFDGYWMILGATLAVLLVGPLVWRWPRDRSLMVIAVASAIGSVIPLWISALRHKIPIVARLRGAWILAGADLVGPAMVVGFVCLWFALREWTPPLGAPQRRTRGKRK